MTILKVRAAAAELSLHSIFRNAFTLMITCQFLVSCGQQSPVPDKEVASPKDTVEKTGSPAPLQPVNLPTFSITPDILNSLFTGGQNLTINFKTLLFTFQFPDGTTNVTSFKLAMYRAKDHQQMGEGAVPVILSGTGFSPAAIEVKDIQLGNLEMDIDKVLKGIIVNPGHTLDPNFDHIELSPAMDVPHFGTRLFYKAEVIFKVPKVLVAPPAGSYNANPSPPAAPTS